MKNHIPNFNEFVNESSINESWSNTDTDKAAEIINKEIGVNPGYFFIGDKDLIKQFDKFWNEKKYKMALNLLMDIENLKDLKDFIKQNESKINEAKNIKAKPFDKVKPGDKAEVIGLHGELAIVLAKGTGAEYDKVLKKYDESGIVGDMKRRPDNYGLDKGDFDEIDFVAVKHGSTIAVYTYEFDGAIVPA